MNRMLRVVLVLYCLLFAYCCLWVPWHLVQAQDRVRAGYGWLWRGPVNPPVDAILTTPDLAIIALRIPALTAITAAVFLVGWT